ncbi:MAG: hypothetical protein ACK446_08365, partial [Rhodobacterales bacterium]
MGAPLILLHGRPQNGMCRWRAAAAFAARNRVNIPDPRGGGQSVALADDAARTTCSRRATAQGIVARMAAPGLSQAAVPGHDRARVACGLAPEHPRRVTGTGIIEIAPISDDRAARLADMGLAACHGTLPAQPAPLSGRMITRSPVTRVDRTAAPWKLPKRCRPRGLPDRNAADSSARRGLAGASAPATRCASHRPAGGCG